MEKKYFFKSALLLSILFCLLWGCVKKEKGFKTIQGDPEVLYKQGLALFNKRNYPEALKKFEELKSSFPDSPPYTLWAELKVGDCHFFKKDYVEAIAAYEEFRKIHPTHEEIPYVQYQIGMSHFNQMATPDRDQTSTKKALSSFEYLVANYPPSVFTEKAKDKINVCKKRLAESEFEIGKFYYQQEKFEIAINRFKELLKKFPKIEGEDKTLFLLGMSYLGLDQKEKAREAFMRIVTEYPKSQHYKESKVILNQEMKKAEKKIIFFKIKPKEPKKKAKVKKAEPEGTPLVKFEDEPRQPISLTSRLPIIRDPVKPAPSSPPQAESKIEGKPKEAKKPKEGLKIPMIPVEEGKKSISPPEAEPKKEAKLEEIKRPEKETKVILTPEEVKSIPSRAEPKSERKPQEEGRIAFLPVPQTRPKEEEKPKKEVSPETDKGKFVDTGQPIDITSDKVETYSKENLVLFKGNVTARQKDIVIYADTLEAVIVGDGKGIEKVVASGNVKIQQGLRVANCQQAVFYNLDQKVILTGAPRVWEGNNMVSGNEIIFDIKQDRIEVKGGKDEGGKARIYPEEKIEKLK